VGGVVVVVVVTPPWFNLPLLVYISLYINFT
jgi:hypothetical protein